MDDQPLPRLGVEQHPSLDGHHHRPEMPRPGIGHDHADGRSPSPIGRRRFQRMNQPVLSREEGPSASFQHIGFLRGIQGNRGFNLVQA